jgi:hypothetical protein
MLTVGGISIFFRVSSWLCFMKSNHENTLIKNKSTQSELAQGLPIGQDKCWFTGDLRYPDRSATLLSSSQRDFQILCHNK